MSEAKGTPDDSPLLRVTDLSESIPGQFCARLLADVGASVVMIEPPIGSWTRRRGPYLPGAARPDDSALFFHLNLAKKSVTLDYSCPTGMTLLPQLLSECDVVITPEDKELRSRVVEAGGGAEAKIYCEIEAFAPDNAMSSWTANEMIYQALSGVMFENGSAEREPLFGCGYRSQYATGVMAYVAVLAAAMERAESGNGQRVGARAATVAASMSCARASQFLSNGTFERRGSPTAVEMPLQCADGWVVLVGGEKWWPRVCRFLGVTDLLDDPSLQTEADRRSRWPEVRARFSDALSTRKVSEVLGDEAAQDVVVAKVALPRELVTEPHLVARSYWQRVDWEGAERPLLGPWIRFDGEQSGASVPPRLGEHNFEFYTAIGLSAEEIEVLRDAEVV